ncbi:MAG: recombinase family protein [Lachnospiraceae bacterium]
MQETWKRNKTVTKDFLTHRSVENKGEAPRYYVKNHHEAIIDRMTWEKVQAILGQKRKVSSENRKEGETS